MIKIETEKSMVNSINIKRDIYFEIFIPWVLMFILDNYSENDRSCILEDGES
jgi:hypothetical protein